MLRYDKIKKRILVVDDDPDICLTLRETFKLYGFTVNSFTDPQAALNSFEAGLYDLLLLDIKMPEMDGFQLYQDIKKIDNDVKVCFLTAGEYPKSVKTKEFCSLDKELFLQKPIENEQLILELNKLLEY